MQLPLIRATSPVHIWHYACSAVQGFKAPGTAIQHCSDSSRALGRLVCSELRGVEEIPGGGGFGADAGVEAAGLAPDVEAPLLKSGRAMP